MKKLLTVLLVLVFMFSMTTTVYAATPNPSSPSSESLSGTQKSTLGAQSYAQAVTNNADNTSYDIAITANLTAPNAVYSVTIAWGSLQFEYQKGAWNPTTHQYDTNGQWVVPTGDANKVTVTNHSNLGVNVNMTGELYTDDAGTTPDTNVTVKFYGTNPAHVNGTDLSDVAVPEVNTFALATAEGTTIENAPKQDLFVILNSPEGTTPAQANTVVAGSPKVQKGRIVVTIS